MLGGIGPVADSAGKPVCGGPAGPECEQQARQQAQERVGYGPAMVEAQNEDQRTSSRQNKP